MHRRPSAAFTLIEIVTAMTVILILTGLVIGIAGFVSKKSNRTRCADERHALEMSLNNYRAEFGQFPQDEASDALQPKTHFIASEQIYRRANLTLYKELTGDRYGSGGPGSEPDGVIDDGAKAYWEQRNENMIKVERDANRRVVRVLYIQDPWGDPYGYSTASLLEEQRFQARLKASDGTAERVRQEGQPGFNLSAPDLWSTANTRPSSQPSSLPEKEQQWAQWIKNW